MNQRILGCLFPGIRVESTDYKRLIDGHSCANQQLVIFIPILLGFRYVSWHPRRSSCLGFLFNKKMACRRQQHVEEVYEHEMDQRIDQRVEERVKQMMDQMMGQMG